MSAVHPKSTINLSRGSRAVSEGPMTVVKRKHGAHTAIRYSSHSPAEALPPVLPTWAQ